MVSDCDYFGYSIRRYDESGRPCNVPFRLPPPNKVEKLDSENVGLVVGTYGGLPYVHLQLESRKRFYPQVPVLVHDDASDKHHDLLMLCQDYAVEFETNHLEGQCKRNNLGHQVGDLSVFVGGLTWASQHGLEVLVKVSRRFIPLTNWVPALQRLATESRGATFAGQYLDRRDAIRTDCIALRVNDWVSSALHLELLSAIVESLETGRQQLFVENVMLLKAKRARSLLGRHEESDYVDWPYLAQRAFPQMEPAYIWHDLNPGGDYYRLSRAWDLPYSLSAFEEDPNS